MKKNGIILSVLIIIGSIIAIILWLKPTNQPIATTPLNTSNTTKQINHNAIDGDNTTDTANTAKYQSPTDSPTTAPNTSHTDLQLSYIIQQIELVMTQVGTRSHKISTLLSLFQKSTDDAGKITALQALAGLSPIEYSDELIAIANDTKQSDKVRATAVQTLNDAYTLDDDLVQQIGGATVMVQMDKISQYMNELVTNPQTPTALREDALFGYSYTNYEKAPSLAKQLIQQKQLSSISEAEGRFIIDTMIASSENMAVLLPILQQNAQILDDDMITSLAATASEAVILQDISDADKHVIVELLQNHQLDKNDPMYEVNKQVLPEYIKMITNS